MKSRYFYPTALCTLWFAIYLALGHQAQASIDVPRYTETPIPPGATLDCGDGDPLGDEHPAAIDMVGDVANGYWSAAVWHDTDDTGYLYIGMRVDHDPGGPHGFAQYAWVALMQMPSDDPFTYQYLLSLQGNGQGGGNDTVELWHNTSAVPIAFDPIFNDPAETLLWSADYATGGPSAAPFHGARAIAEQADSALGGDADYLIFWSIPVAELISQGMIASHSDLDDALFFAATSANANNFNKDHLACPFGPARAALDINKTVNPSIIIQDQVSTVTFTIEVSNTSAVRAEGVVVEDHDFAGCMVFDASNVTVDPCVGCGQVTIVTAATPDLVVRLDYLAAGSLLSLAVVADVTTCVTGGTNSATAFATNATKQADQATVLFVLPVELSAFTVQSDGQDALLFWETLSETNNAGFKVQHRYRRQQTTSFATLDFVEGYGTTPTSHTYQYRVEKLEPGWHVFRLQQIDFSGAIAYSPEVETFIDMGRYVVLEPAFPNPFNLETQFRFAVAHREQVRVSLYDMRGRLMGVLYEGHPPAGQMHTVRIDGRALSSGFYMARIEGETFVRTQPVVLVK